MEDVPKTDATRKALRRPRHEVKVGQIWEDCDWRMQGRRLRVIGLTENYAVMVNVVEGTRPPHQVQVRLDRMYEHQRGFKLIEQAPGEVK